VLRAWLTRGVVRITEEVGQLVHSAVDLMTSHKQEEGEKWKDEEEEEEEAEEEGEGP